MDLLTINGDVSAVSGTRREWGPSHITGNEVEFVHCVERELHT